MSGCDINRVRVLNKLVGTSSDEAYIPLDLLEVDRSKPGFIKVDVDGPECDVLDSGTSLLTSGNSYLLIQTHSLST
jgi:hypothetical protein